MDSRNVRSAGIASTSRRVGRSQPIITPKSRGHSTSPTKQPLTSASALTRGLIAGAVGSSALNAVAFADMAMRGRAPSETPANVVKALARQSGARGLGSEAPTDATKHRRSALGALSGYGIGLAVATVYALVRSRLRVPPAVGALVLGAAAMASSDLPASRLGVTDPAEWSPADWLSDVLPHAAYGIGAALALEMFVTKG